jgi:hypothetical protein
LGDALVSLQRQALTGFSAGGVAGWDAVLALSLTTARFIGRDSMKLDSVEEDMSLTEARFTGRDSIKLDREEEDMIAVL